MNQETIEYRTDSPVTVDDFIDLLNRSTLGERRPVDDRACMTAMIENADLVVSAWAGDRLVGIARSVTDFAYCCYLSDLAVCGDYQRRGIGLELQRRTLAALGPKCKLILLSAPAAVEYYPRIGFERHESCWTVDQDVELGDAPS